MQASKSSTKVPKTQKITSIDRVNQSANVSTNKMIKKKLAEKLNKSGIKVGGNQKQAKRTSMSK